MIAKSLKTDETEDGNIQLIYTMATPHSNPPMIFDPELDLFYYFVQRNFTKANHVEGNETVRKTAAKTSVVSIAGGRRDFLVSEKLTKWTYNTIQTSVKDQ